MLRRWGLYGLFVMVLAGCRPESDVAAPSDPSNAPTDPATSTAKAGETDGDVKVTSDASGRKWLTSKIPYDVFPDLPPDDVVAAAGADAPRGPVTAMPSDDLTADAPAAPVATPATETPLPNEPASDDWQQVLPAENLQTEIAAVRNSLSEKLLTVGSYNEAFESVANDGWLMSALATIATEHPAAMSWKENALLVRDGALGVAIAATGRGRQNFTAAQLANDQLSAVLNNNTPPGLPTPDPAASREETADRAALMTRMQAAFDKLKEAGDDDAALKSGATSATHEARILAALAKFTAHGDYGSTAEPEYQAAAGEAIAAGGSMAEAAAAGDPATFGAAFDRVGTACNKCHEKYRFSN